MMVGEAMDIFSTPGLGQTRGFDSDLLDPGLFF